MHQKMHKTAQKILNLATLCDTCWQHSGCNSAALGAAPSSEIWKCKAPSAPLVILVPRAPPCLPEMIHREPLRYSQIFGDRNLASFESPRTWQFCIGLTCCNAAKKHLQHNMCRYRMIYIYTSQSDLMKSRYFRCAFFFQTLPKSLHFTCSPQVCLGLVRMTTHTATGQVDSWTKLPGRPRLEPVLQVSPAPWSPRLGGVWSPQTTPIVAVYSPA